MTDSEIDEFLRAQSTCRVATVGANGAPHVAPLWFVWDGTSLWLSSLTRSQRWADVMANPRMAIVIDAGSDYLELRGVEVNGSATAVGPVPRDDSPHSELDEVEAMFGTKYMPGGRFAADGRHGWLRVRPDKIVSWDFRKIAEVT
ncbi:MAG TPA: pyridoxamine 5'-phosphate oxidase family protein [Ilumatobacteraceae bacterium]|nr:pyridoxamine 5'-phosphate oxidase family protein [Ilumatobacteraceae bacterium]HRB01972.1 pyridoxamine 5'-phosphate oxidase family protein [Ilumatobacteraceae bacterium]